MWNRRKCRMTNRIHTRVVNSAKNSLAKFQSKLKSGRPPKLLMPCQKCVHGFLALQYIAVAGCKTRRPIWTVGSFRSTAGAVEGQNKGRRGRTGAGPFLGPWRALGAAWRSVGLQEKKKVGGGVNSRRYLDDIFWETLVPRYGICSPVRVLSR